MRAEGGGGGGGRILRDRGAYAEDARSEGLGGAGDRKGLNRITSRIQGFTIGDFPRASARRIPPYRAYFPSRDVFQPSSGGAECSLVFATRRLALGEREILGERAVRHRIAFPHFPAGEKERREAHEREREREKRE